MKKLSRIIWLAFFVTGITANAQEKAAQKPAAKDKKKQPVVAQKPRTEKEWLQAQIDSLTSPVMCGRGYVRGGLDSAARYLLRQFHELKLKPIDKAESFTQGFAFPVNTFPGKMKLVFGEDQLNPGADYLIDPASSSFSGTELEVQRINLGKIRDAGDWKEKLASLDDKHAYIFENGEKLCEILQVKKDEFFALLPKGVYIIPEDKKLMWRVSRETMPATVFYVKADLIPKKIKSVSADVTAQFVPRAWNINLIGAAPGDVKDSYIVFTAHYDHLGMMGDSAVFPGGSDNASGVAMLLSLASFFRSHPQHYTILFIAFAGEEASLMGSEFFTWQPLVPLKNIKFLTNIDIMGDATDGISVVNAMSYPRQFDMLQKINEVNNYVPKIYAKPSAANGDQYHFTEKGVPSFFIYSNGGHGFYHDIYDSGDILTLNNVTGVAKMLIEFVRQLQ